MTQLAETRSGGGKLLSEGEQDVLQPVESVTKEVACRTAVRQLALSAVSLIELLSNQVRLDDGQNRQASELLNGFGRVRWVRSRLDSWGFGAAKNTSTLWGQR